MNKENIVMTGADYCEFPYKSRVMPTREPLKTLKAPYMARNPMKQGFFKLKRQEIPLKNLMGTKCQPEKGKRGLKGRNARENVRKKEGF